MKLHQDIRGLIELCLSRKVEFLLVCGYALAFHGAPRFTEDIDILTGISGVTWQEAWASRNKVNLDGIKIHVIGKAQLMQNKQATGLHKTSPTLPGSSAGWPELLENHRLLLPLIACGANSSRRWHHDRRFDEFVRVHLNLKQSQRRTAPPAHRW